MTIIDKVKTWWKQKQRVKKLRLACVQDKPPILRCLALTEYMMEIDFSGVSHHELMFRKTRLRCHSLNHYVSVLMFLCQHLREEKFLTRGNTKVLGDLMSTSQTSIFSFLGSGDHNSAIKEFLRCNNTLCGELSKCLDRDDIGSRHTLKLVQSYIDTLEETLVVMLKMAQ